MVKSTKKDGVDRLKGVVRKLLEREQMNNQQYVVELQAKIIELMEQLARMKGTQMTDEAAKKAVDEYFKNRAKDIDHLNKHDPGVKDLDEVTRRLIEKMKGPSNAR